MHKSEMQKFLLFEPICMWNNFFNKVKSNSFYFFILKWTQEKNGVVQKWMNSKAMCTELLAGLFIY